MPYPKSLQTSFSIIHAIRHSTWVKSLCFGLALMFTAGACIPNKQLVYLQDPNLQAGGGPVSFNSERLQYKLQTGDILSVQVKGVDAELQNSFNMVGGAFAMSFADPANMYLQGYSIDEQGNITLTTAGKVAVRGLTVAEATEVVQKRMSQYLKEATIQVRLVSFKITILGEVKRPGYYLVNNTRATLLEGLGLGGDLTNIGNRQRIKVIRQTQAGTEVAMVDLTDANFIRSPYYFLMPNDVVYVEPFSGQLARKNFAPVTLGLGILSGIGTITLLIYTLTRNNN